MSSNPKFCFHALSLPHTVTTPEYNACAYTMKVLKFCKMMKARGHIVIHYGHKDSVVDADEHVSLLDNDDLVKAYGSYNWKKDFFKHNVGDHCNVKFQELGTTEVLKRLGTHKNPDGSHIQDFVLAFWGIGHKNICDAAKATGKAIICEPGIGYGGSFMNFRVFESYAWMHMTYGEQKISKPSWYHTVIPNYFDPEEFKFSPIKSDYFLCLGRISTCKGLHIVVQAALKYKFKLVIAGQGNLQDVGCPDPPPENIIYYGYADVEARKKLMAYAKGFIILSDYPEPFGGAAVEALMSGTPVISTDWGVFNETNQHNLTGYRIRTFEHLVYAIKNIDKINPLTCRKWAMDNYSLVKVAKMYEEYFSQLENLNRKGWYEAFDDRKELSWLERIYPSNEEPPALIDDIEVTSHLANIKSIEALFPKIEDSKKQSFPEIEDSKKQSFPEIEDSKKQSFPESYDSKKITVIPEIKILKPVKKIAFWMLNNWAMGRIHNAIIKYMIRFFGEENVNITFFNWSLIEDTSKLIETWKDYDLIISNTSIYNDKFKFFKHLYSDDKFLSKVVSVSHTPLIRHSYFDENIDNLNREQLSKIRLGHVCNSGAEIWKKHYNLDKILYLPCGVDLEDFPYREKLRYPRNIGIIGKPDYQDDVEAIKQISMFKEIVKYTALNPVYIHSRPFTENAKLYEDVDMLICCSTVEAGPLGILEAASMGIPVFSTKVGNLVELESIKFFENADEASKIINNFLSNPEDLIKYVNNVTNEVRQKFNWETLVEKYWSKLL
jgi:glycosyltransferase involved in cell wall biosynthesis